MDQRGENKLLSSVKESRANAAAIIVRPPPLFHSNEHISGEKGQNERVSCCFSFSPPFLFRYPAVPHANRLFRNQVAK